MEITKNYKGMWTAEVNGTKLEWTTKKGLLEKIEELAPKESYRVIDYFDVWGNEKDGFEVNNLAEVGTIQLIDYTDRREMLKRLKEIDYFKKTVRHNQLEVWNDYDMIEIYQKKDMRPVCRLERIRD